MADYDSNMIKPVVSLQNITGLSPAKRREERKRREQSYQEPEKEDDRPEDKKAEPESRTENHSGRENRKIDYCA